MSNVEACRGSIAVPAPDPIPSEELEEVLVDFVYDLLVMRTPKHKILNALRQANNGNRIAKTSWTNLYDAARLRMALEYKKSLPHHREDALVLFMACINDPKASWAEKLKAQAAMDDLLGLGVRHNVGSTPEDVAAAIVDLTAKMRGSLA